MTSDRPPDDVLAPAPFAPPYGGDDAAIAARLLEGAKTTPENAFKLKLVERTLAAVLAEAKRA